MKRQQPPQEPSEPAAAAPRHRFYAPDLSTSAATLAGNEAHHALHVLRLRPGAKVELFDGFGRRALAAITATRRDAVELAVEQIEGPLPRAVPAVHLAFAAPKGNRLDWLLEKAAELGAASLQPLVTNRSVVAVRDEPQTLRRWQAICAAAVRQSRQTYLPEILPPAALNDVLNTPTRGLGIIAHAGAGSLSLRQALAGMPDAVHMLIGPEGGWTDDELTAASAAGYQAACLGQTILRVETAAIALAAAAIALAQP